MASKTNDPRYQKIIDHLDKIAPKAARAHDISKLFGYERKWVSHCLSNMATRGLISKKSPGWYQKLVPESPGPMLVNNFLSRPAGAPIT